MPRAASGNRLALAPLMKHSSIAEVSNMGRGILLWLLGIPLPIIILILIFWN